MTRATPTADAVKRVIEFMEAQGVSLSDVDLWSAVTVRDDLTTSHEVAFETLVEAGEGVWDEYLDNALNDRTYDLLCDHALIADDDEEDD